MQQWSREREWAKRAGNVSLLTLRAWTHNGKMLYEEEKEWCQSKQVGFTLDKQRREARKSEWAVRARRIRRKTMDWCNGNPIMQWHGDKHSQMLIACVPQKRIVSQARQKMAAQEWKRASSNEGSTSWRGWRRKSKALPVKLTRKRRT